MVVTNTTAVAAGDGVDIEVPALIMEVADARVEQEDTALDLANVVQSAAKGITTIQEAPAIVTVLTAEDIADRGLTSVEEALDIVPGWMRIDAIHSQYPFGLTRGTVQAMLYMHNGVSMFDPFGNTAAVADTMPLETVKRIEIITGPGGVLWGSNSYMGVVNVITKDAEDIAGVEAMVGYGDGPGGASDLRGYVMAGITELISDDVSAFVHASFRNTAGPTFTMPQHLFSTPLPFPNSQMLYGPLTESNNPRSTYIVLDGKLSVGSVSLRLYSPFIERNLPLGFPGVVTEQLLPEATKDIDGDGVLDCSFVEPFLENGQPNPAAFSSEDRCVDRGRIGGANRVDNFDRYVTADWRTRFADGRGGAAVKAYAVYFQRGFQNLNILSPSILLEGGLNFRFQLPQYRIGTSFDGDFELPGNTRLLYGVEVIREWVPANTTESRQGRGIQSNVVAPYDYSRTPLPCPRQPNPDQPGTSQFVPYCPLTFMFPADRTVFGVYANPQWRPMRRLILDVGARLQAAPDALSENSYPLQTILSGAAVYELARHWHAKINYAEGFRPPVFNNTNANGASINIGGDPDLEVEHSQAIQGEVNARLFKNQRHLREIAVRADYSYTKLENLIQIRGGRYENTADRGIHSAELLAKVYLKGGHRFELGYTWLKVATADAGYLRAMPEHWFNMATVFNLVPDTLQASTMLKVVGAHEDPNRLIEFRNLEDVPYDPDTLNGENALVSEPHELVFDRLPPTAELTVGLVWFDAFGIDDLRGSAFAYNAFNGRYYQPDAFYSIEPRLELMPNPALDFRFLANLTYAY